MECLGTITKSGTRFTYYKDEKGGIHYPYLEGNTLHYIKAGKVKQIVFASREDAEERLAEMKEGVK